MKTTTLPVRPPRTVLQAHRAFIAAGFSSLIVGLASAQPINYTDDFESATLNPFWSTHASSGFVTFPSTVRAHSGSQSVELNSTQGTGEKNIGVFHDFSIPVFGQVSLWAYDTGADVQSANYLTFRLTGPNNVYLDWHVFDFDLGPANGGNYLYSISDSGGMIQGFNSGVDRTQAWHQFAISSNPGSLILSLDGIPIYSGSDGKSFTHVEFEMFGPSFRPAWAYQIDDVQIAVVPEPSTLALGGLGLVGVWFICRRKA